MVNVNLQFDIVTATPNGIIVKHPDGNISQSNQSTILKLPFLPVEARCVHLFDTLASGLLLSLEKLCDTGCIDYFNAKNAYIFFQGKMFLPRSQIYLHYIHVET